MAGHSGKCGVDIKKLTAELKGAAATARPASLRPALSASSTSKPPSAVRKPMSPTPLTIGPSKKPVVAKESRPAVSPTVSPSKKAPPRPPAKTPEVRPTLPRTEVRTSSHSTTELPAEPAPRETKTPNWFLGFDPATKSFAHVLVEVPNVEALKAAGRGEGLTDSVVMFRDGATIDLFPGRADKSIHAVERIRAVVEYVEKVVLPAVTLKTRGQRVRVCIEFQMGANAKTRMVCAALLTLFSKYDVCLVAPALKSKIWFAESGRYYRFLEKYSTTYTANKEHAKHNFDLIICASRVSLTLPAATRGHVADAFMLIAGHVSSGDEGIDPHMLF
jgi:hypothetical protein